MHGNIQWLGVQKWYGIVWYGYGYGRLSHWERYLRGISRLLLPARATFYFLGEFHFSANVRFHHQQTTLRKLFATSLVLKIQYMPLPIDNSNFRLHLCQGGGWLNITTGPPVCQGHFLHPPGGSYFPTHPGRASARNYIFRSSRGHVHCRPCARSNIFSPPTGSPTYEHC